MLVLLFEPQTHTKATAVDDEGVKTSPVEDEEPGLEEDRIPFTDTVSAVITTPPAPLTTSTESPAAENDLNSSHDEAEGQPCQDPDSVASASPAVQTPADELPAIPAVEDDLTAGAKAPPHTAIHNGLNGTQEETEEQPAPSSTCSSYPRCGTSCRCGGV